ncbi:hypothetical protein CONCODRAFT_7974 [Conidiobolus coronatus NRRL 28638]|uniref:WD40 repeat-like protein n=1 Tax=Conidiobolus coronatus (strain ATCC 28846 / CBS 209.66 / NRRL 28638) TaxID=796925 RepID=A0A137P3G6_CONC2|nr:hypothetical protein CONCODRAFT_7974 [Conidiobolus coronatus NRRL 28638]|eukprot:KXN69563.1 hypothetical protein CONCODRAFT_7974 [Conidiobolus coronatus NRRL 28638]
MLMKTITTVTAETKKIALEDTQRFILRYFKSHYGLVASGAQDTNIITHNLNNIESGLTSDFINPIMTLTEHPSLISNLYFNQTTLVSVCEYCTIVSSSLDNSICVWDIRIGKVVDKKYRVNNMKEENQ